LQSRFPYRKGFFNSKGRAVIRPKPRVGIRILSRRKFIYDYRTGLPKKEKANRFFIFSGGRTRINCHGGRNEKETFHQRSAETKKQFDAADQRAV
jgi:hypothetical protein